MTKDELIVKQQLELEELRDERIVLYHRLTEIQQMLICIGGPLNDNKHKFTKEQMDIFHEIYERCE